MGLLPPYDNMKYLLESWVYTLGELLHRVDPSAIPYSPTHTHYQVVWGSFMLFIIAIYQIFGLVNDVMETKMVSNTNSLDNVDNSP